jgi:hypothetical protein
VCAARVRGDTTTVLKRDTRYHTYADYLTWSASHGDELIEGQTPLTAVPGITIDVDQVLREIF